MSPDGSAILQPGVTVKNQFLVSRQVGKGAFGSIFEATVVDRPDFGPVAIKIENDTTIRKVLKLEITVLKKLQGKKIFPKFFAEGFYKGKRFFVMEMLGYNLSDLLRKRPTRRFSIQTVLNLAYKMLTCIQELHSVQWIHRDIKPSNFVIGREGKHVHRIYLIDFGLAKRTHTDDGFEFSERPNVGFRGTARYASVNAHKSKDLGRMDDLWSLLYCLVEFHKGTLPWTRMKDKAAIGRKKEEIEKHKLLEGMPTVFFEFYDYISSLSFQDVPDYATLLQKFKQTLIASSPRISTTPLSTITPIELSIPSSVDFFDWERDPYPLSATTHSTSSPFDTRPSIDQFGHSPALSSNVSIPPQGFPEVTADIRDDEMKSDESPNTQHRQNRRPPGLPIPGDDSKRTGVSPTPQLDKGGGKGSEGKGNRFGIDIEQMNHAFDDLLNRQLNHQFHSPLSNTQQAANTSQCSHIREGLSTSNLADGSVQSLMSPGSKSSDLSPASRASAVSVNSALSHTPSPSLLAMNLSSPSTLHIASTRQEITAQNEQKLLLPGISNEKGTVESSYSPLGSAPTSQGTSPIGSESSSSSHKKLHSTSSGESQTPPLLLPIAQLVSPYESISLVQHPPDPPSNHANHNPQAICAPLSFLLRQTSLQSLNSTTSTMNTFASMAYTDDRGEEMNSPTPTEMQQFSIALVPYTPHVPNLSHSETTQTLPARLGLKKEEKERRVRRGDLRMTRVMSPTMMQMMQPEPLPRMIRSNTTQTLNDRLMYVSQQRMLPIYSVNSDAEDTFLHASVPSLAQLLNMSSTVTPALSFQSNFSSMGNNRFGRVNNTRIPSHFSLNVLNNPFLHHRQGSLMGSKELANYIDMDQMELAETMTHTVYTTFTNTTATDTINDEDTDNGSFCSIDLDKAKQIMKQNDVQIVSTGLPSPPRLYQSSNGPYPLTPKSPKQVDGTDRSHRFSSLPPNSPHGIPRSPTLSHPPVSPHSFPRSPSQLHAPPHTPTPRYPSSQTSHSLLSPSSVPPQFPSPPLIPPTNTMDQSDSLSAPLTPHTETPELPDQQSDVQDQSSPVKESTPPTFSSHPRIANIPNLIEYWVLSVFHTNHVLNSLQRAVVSLFARLQPMQHPSELDSHSIDGDHSPTPVLTSPLSIFLHQYPNPCHSPGSISLSLSMSQGVTPHANYPTASTVSDLEYSHTSLSVDHPYFTLPTPFPYSHYRLNQSPLEYLGFHQIESSEISSSPTASLSHSSTHTSTPSHARSASPSSGTATGTSTLFTLLTQHTPSRVAWNFPISPMHLFSVPFSLNLPFSNGYIHPSPSSVFDFPTDPLQSTPFVSDVQPSFTPSFFANSDYLPSLSLPDGQATAHSAISSSSSFSRKHHHSNHPSTSSILSGHSRHFASPHPPSSQSTPNHSLKPKSHVRTHSISHSRAQSKRTSQKPFGGQEHMIQSVVRPSDLIHNQALFRTLIQKPLSEFPKRSLSLPDLQAIRDLPFNLLLPLDFHPSNPSSPTHHSNHMNNQVPLPVALAMLTTDTSALASGCGSTHTDHTSESTRRSIPLGKTHNESTSEMSDADGISPQNNPHSPTLSSAPFSTHPALTLPSPPPTQAAQPGLAQLAYGTQPQQGLPPPSSSSTSTHHHSQRAPSDSTLLRLPLSFLLSLPFEEQVAVLRHLNPPQEKGSSTSNTSPSSDQRKEYASPSSVSSTTDVNRWLSSRSQKTPSTTSSRLGSVEEKTEEHSSDDHKLMSEPILDEPKEGDNHLQTLPLINSLSTSSVNSSHSSPGLLSSSFNPLPLSALPQLQLKATHPLSIQHTASSLSGDTADDATRAQTDLLSQMTGNSHLNTHTRTTSIVTTEATSPVTTTVSGVPTSRSEEKVDELIFSQNEHDRSKHRRRHPLSVSNEENVEEIHLDRQQTTLFSSLDTQFGFDGLSHSSLLTNESPTHQNFPTGSRRSLLNTPDNSGRNSSPRNSQGSLLHSLNGFEPFLNSPSGDTSLYDAPFTTTSSLSHLPLLLRPPFTPDHSPHPLTEHAELPKRKAHRRNLPSSTNLDERRDEEMPEMWAQHFEFAVKKVQQEFQIDNITADDLREMIVTKETKTRPKQKKHRKPKRASQKAPNERKEADPTNDDLFTLSSLDMAPISDSSARISKEITDSDDLQMRTHLTSPSHSPFHMASPHASQSDSSQTLNSDSPFTPVPHTSQLSTATASNTRFSNSQQFLPLSISLSSKDEHSPPKQNEEQKKRVILLTLNEDGTIDVSRAITISDTPTPNTVTSALISHLAGHTHNPTQWSSPPSSPGQSSTKEGRNEADDPKEKHVTRSDHSNRGGSERASSNTIHSSPGRDLSNRSSPPRPSNQPAPPVKPDPDETRMSTPVLLQPTTCSCVLF